MSNLVSVGLTGMTKMLDQLSSAHKAIEMIFLQKSITEGTLNLNYSKLAEINLNLNLHLSHQNESSVALFDTIDFVRLF